VDCRSVDEGDISSLDAGALSQLRRHSPRRRRALLLLPIPTGACWARPTWQTDAVSPTVAPLIGEVSPWRTRALARFLTNDSPDRGDPCACSDPKAGVIPLARSTGAPSERADRALTATPKRISVCILRRECPRGCVAPWREVAERQATHGPTDASRWAS
jgi:hypothetical protein